LEEAQSRGQAGARGEESQGCEESEAREETLNRAHEFLVVPESEAILLLEQAAIASSRDAFLSMTVLEALVGYRPAEQTSP
jgi:hypothetical protein